MNTLQVLKYGLSLTLDGYHQLAFINRFLKPLINQQCERIGYKLNPPEKKKALFYYPMYTILGCAEMYIALKGRRLTNEERKRLTLVAAMATLTDDLIDEDNWNREQIFDIAFNQPSEDRLPAKAKLLVALNKEFYATCNVPHSYAHQLRIALDWQVASAKQLDPNITLDEIVHISREKNGHTSLMFATLVNEDWIEKELEFIYQTAIVGQFTNDSFDMYFDTQNGIKTYFNTAPSMQQVKDFFLNECRKLHSLVRQCPATVTNQQNTIRRMSILHAFTLTAIDQFMETEAKYGRPIDWKSVPRKDMVIDMAKNSNRWKTVRYMKWLSEQ